MNQMDMNQSDDRVCDVYEEILSKFLRANVDHWRPSNKDSHFLRFALVLREKSKQVFLADQTHPEIFFLLREDGLGFGQIPPCNLGRDQMAQKVRQTIRDFGAYGVVQISEAWIPLVVMPPDQRFNQHQELETPQSRTERRGGALIASVQSREGFTLLWATPILRDAGRVMLGDSFRLSTFCGGRFVGLFEPERCTMQTLTEKFVAGCRWEYERQYTDKMSDGYAKAAREEAHHYLSPDDTPWRAFLHGTECVMNTESLFIKERGAEPTREFMWHMYDIHVLLGDIISLIDFETFCRTWREHWEAISLRPMRKL